MQNPLQEDSDFDGYGNACDNCQDEYNEDQLNTDQDRWGNACDNCQTVSNDGQEDHDGDWIGDVCDPCDELEHPDPHDEDNDGVRDECDNCPGIYNEEQGNVGEQEAGHEPDEVGDVCDMRPTEPGDVIAAVDGFGGSSLSSRWTIGNGTWNLIQDALQCVETTSSVRLDDTVAPPARHAVEAEFSFNSLDANPQTAGVVFRKAANEGVACLYWYSEEEANGFLALRYLNSDAATGDIEDVNIDPPVLGTSYRMRVVVDGDQFTCELQHGSEWWQAKGTQPGLTLTPPALRVYKTSATYNYFVWYNLGP